jgi:3-hydroxyacyl-[acyl-carrier-protein] dehydratase
MAWVMVDRVLEFTPRGRIVAVKAVSPSEEYLADHFPTFPVMPGVLMLEAMVEAARWLVLESRAFAPAVILLGWAKNVTYKSFVRPGSALQVEVTCQRLADGESEFSGIGVCGESEAVRARFSLTHRAWAPGSSNASRAPRSAVTLAGALRAEFETLRSR